MSWKAVHRRGETLRAVLETANDRSDGRLPMDVPGVAENFESELDLIGALLLKWHARLSVNIERALQCEPLDRELAVGRAWRSTAEQLPGVRMIIDRCAEHPVNLEMERAMTRASRGEQARLALAAGLASGQGSAAVEAGRLIEQRGRRELVTASVPGPVIGTDVAADRVADARTVAFVDRIRAALVA